MKKLFLTFLKDIQAVPSYFPYLPFHIVLFGIGVSISILIFIYWIMAKGREISYRMLDSDGQADQIYIKEKSNRLKASFSRLSTLQSICLIILVFYLVFLFIITTIARTPSGSYLYDFRLLHSYWTSMRSGYIIGRMQFYNICMLVPLGILLPIILQFRVSWKDILLLSFVYSASIESTQLLFKLGCFELDDLFNNMLGAMAAYVTVIIIRSVNINW